MASGWRQNCKKTRGVGIVTGAILIAVHSHGRWQCDGHDGLKMNACGVHQSEAIISEAPAIDAAG